MPAAIIGAGIAAVGGIASAAISSGASHHAADIAQQTANQNNAVQQQIYSSNKAEMQPYVDRGNTAGSYYNALLGLPGPAAPTTANDNGSSAGGYNRFATGANDPWAAWDGGGQGYQTPPATQAQQPSALPSAQNAFNTFLGSDGYQFRLGQGLNSLQTQYAAHGALDSGAAMKSMNNYAQGEASNEFGKYMGYLDNQQRIGAGSAAALAGVGQNYANANNANNDNAGSAAANAALASGNAWTGAITNAINAYGMYSGMNSSYGGGAKPVNAFGNA
jgi:hypothetical protein